MPEHFLFTDRPQAAAGLEDDSESAWAEFQSLSRAPQMMPGIAKPDPDPQTADAIFARLERLHRVCPKPHAWMALHEFLAGQARGSELPPPPPADAVAWTKTSAVAKAVCFSDHLRWAERHRVLPAVNKFLLALSEEDWHHNSSAKPSLAAQQ